jgi:hypothetical protein
MKQLALFLAAMAAYGQGLGSDARAKKVIDDAIAALGGEKFLKMSDRIESGRAYSFYNSRLSGLSIARIYTRYITLPAGKSGQELGQRERQAFGKDEDFYLLFREDGAWDVTYRGSKPLEQDRIDRYVESTLRNFFYILRQRLNEPGLTFESLGLDVIENIPVEGVDIIDSQNRSVKVYFHQTTKLPVRQEWVFRDPKTRERNVEVTRFARYRDVGGGVQWPQHIQRERDGAKVYEIFSESVVINQGLTDNLFSLAGSERK